MKLHQLKCEKGINLTNNFSFHFIPGGHSTTSVQVHMNLPSINSPSQSHISNPNFAPQLNKNAIHNFTFAKPKTPHLDLDQNSSFSPFPFPQNTIKQQDQK